MSEKTCEVMCIKTGIPDRFGLHSHVCGETASYFARGCVGPVQGRAFVCEKHKNFYAPRILLTMAEYWVLQAEASLGDKKLDL